MIYELRTYTVKQGTVAEVAKISGTLGRDIRKDDYGKLEGYWITEIGPLNQVMHLWSYESASACAASSPRMRAGRLSTSLSRGRTSFARTTGSSMP